MTHVTPPPSPIPILSKEQWREDLHVFAQELTQRHKNPWHLITRKAFEQAVRMLDARIPALKHYEVVVGIQRLAAMIGDGHTRLETHGLYHFFPLEVFWFGQQLRIVRTISAYRQALGMQILKIANHPIREVQRRLQAIIPQAENRWYQLHQSASHLSRVEPLAALGILPQVDDALFTCKDDAGNRFSFLVAPVPPTTSVTWVEAAVPPPLYLQRRDELFWFTTEPDAQTVYVNFRGYRDLERQAAQLWSFVDSHSPKRLVIDIRQNGGGDYTLGREHLVYKVQFRPVLNRTGHLFVVTGRATFSAAMTNAIDFRRETAALLVGEPTGARPNGYQERDQFALPNSQVPVYCSKFYYRFQERATSAVLPDKRIDPDWTAYKVGRDPVMEWIQHHPFAGA
jgi:hypothetical protein